MANLTFINKNTNILGKTPQNKNSDKYSRVGRLLPLPSFKNKIMSSADGPASPEEQGRRVSSAGGNQKASRRLSSLEITKDAVMRHIFHL